MRFKRPLGEVVKMFGRFICKFLAPLQNKNHAPRFLKLFDVRYLGEPGLKTPVIDPNFLLRVAPMAYVNPPPT